MLRNSLSGCSSTFCEHRGKVRSLRVDLLLTSSFAHVAFEGVRVNYGLDFGATLVDHVVGRGEIALLKSVLRRAMPREQVMLHAPLAVNHGGVVVAVLRLFHDHLSCLGLVVVDGGRRCQVELRSGLGYANSPLFLHQASRKGE